MSLRPSRAGAIAAVRIATMRDRDTAQDKAEKAQASLKRKAANTRAADHKRQALEVAAELNEVLEVMKTNCWTRRKADRHNKENYIQIPHPTTCTLFPSGSAATSSSASPTIDAGDTVPRIGPTTTRSKQGPTVQPVEDPNESDDESFAIDLSLEDIVLEEERAPDPANFSDNIGDESDSSLEEEASAHVAVIAYGPAEASTVTSNLVVSKSSHLAPPSIMDDDSEIVISGATAQPKGQALQSSIAGRSLLRPHSKGDHEKRTPASSSSITTSSTLANGPKDLFTPYDGARNTKSIVQEFSKPKRQRHRSDLTDQEKKVAGLWFQEMFLENILDGQGIWRSKRSLYDQSETFADEYNKSGRTRIEWSTKIADLIVSKNLGVLNIIKRAALKCTYKAYGLDPERLPAAAAEKATLWLKNTRWTAKELRCGAGTGGPNLEQCTFEPEEDLQNVLLYEILVQIVAGIMRDRSAALQWPERGLDPSNEDHRELAFALVTHAYAGIRYAMQLLTPPPPNPGSSDRNARETKQAVSLWHEFSATHYQGHVQSILRRRRGEGRGAPYSDAVQVRVTNRVQRSVAVAILGEAPGGAGRGTTPRIINPEAADVKRMTAQQVFDFEESLFD